AVPAGAFGAGAWLLLGVLATALAATLWDRVPLAVLGLAAAALTVPVLAAGPWDAELSAATALRWGLAMALPACSVPLWLRDAVRRVASRAGVDTEPGLPLGRLVRVLFVGGTAGPVLLLTAVVALLGFTGQAPAGPAPG